MKIKELRKQKGWTLLELSNKSGIGISYLSGLENGAKSNPSVKILIKIAKALEIGILELME